MLNKITHRKDLSSFDTQKLISMLENDENLISDIISSVDENNFKLISEFIWITQSRLNAFGLGLTEENKKELKNIYLDEFNKDLYKNLFNYIINNKIKLELSTFKVLIEILLRLKIKFNFSEELNSYLSETQEFIVNDWSTSSPLQYFILTQLSTVINELASSQSNDQYLKSLFEPIIWVNTIQIELAPNSQSLSNVADQIKLMELTLEFTNALFVIIPNLKNLLIEEQ